MKIIVIILLVLLFLAVEIQSQIVTGKLVDENGAGLVEVQLQLYAAPNVYTTASDSDGTFSFDIIVGVEDNQPPTGYSVSNNFPNPFNPRTRIAITLPGRENVKVEVFNLLGQSVADVFEQTLNAGTNYLDIELNGLPNGCYISRITIDEKYTVVKKLMLIYGSQHIKTSVDQIYKPLNNFYTTVHEIILDSLVAYSGITGTKTFRNLPVFTGDTLDLGNLTIERYCLGNATVYYEGKTYNTVQIGSQCWLKENLDVGTRIDSNQEQTNNGTMEKYCYDNDLNNCVIYGGLYQWNEMMQYSMVPGTQGICPVGWHLPTQDELELLAAIVGFDGNALKAIGQGTGNGAGTNTSGFSALLSGICFPSGTFYNLEIDAYLWSSSEYDPNFGWGWQLYYNSSSIVYGNDNKYSGLCVRCIKN
jgi:uncharacterized protein (TIGR02145 family)